MKNIIIFASMAVVLVLVYIFFIKKSPEDVNLVSVSSNQGDIISDVSSTLDRDFLPLLLNVKDIKLDDSIFSDPAFMVLVDSNIVLTPEGNEGRANPFALFGDDEPEPEDETLDELGDLDDETLDELGDLDGILDGSFLEF